jgi:hypothetical protein
MTVQTKKAACIQATLCLFRCAFCAMTQATPSSAALLSSLLFAPNHLLIAAGMIQQNSLLAICNG